MVLFRRSVTSFAGSRQRLSEAFKNYGKSRLFAAKRLKDKDALDVLRILRVIPTKALAEGLGVFRPIPFLAK